jgi:hypothetical protein
MTHAKTDWCYAPDVAVYRCAFGNDDAIILHPGTQDNALKRIADFTAIAGEARFQTNL